MRATLGTFLVVGLLSGLGGLYGLGCNEAENPDRNGENTGVKGTCTPADDDGNPCTAEGCKGSGEEHIPVVGAPCGVGLKCDANAKCAGCSDAAQCGETTECVAYSCTGGICSASFTSQGTAIQSQTQDDCMVNQCNGIGGEETVEDANDHPAGMDCNRFACNAGKLEQVLAMEGEECLGQMNKVCTAGGQCVDCVVDTDCATIPDGRCFMNQCFSCSDGMMNGNETGTDCGGSCKKCDGETCGMPDDCASTFCIDGVCCGESCNEKCRACNVTGFVGICANLPAGEKDLEGTAKCLDTQACSGAGQCVTKAANGEACQNNNDCASNNCMANICAPP